jgi:polar amino acid transport system substrate-binding protein
LALAALEAGKHVFVEKPLCLTRDQLKAIRAKVVELAAADRLPVLQVGFNRRFSAAAGHVKKHFGNFDGPLTMMYRISAGHIPRDHWTQDPVEGGGRILGEVCHFVDLMQFVCGADPVAVSAMGVVSDNAEVRPDDNLVVNLTFADGSVGSIGYFAQGSGKMPKERFEVLGAGRSAVLDNFQKVTLFSPGGKTVKKCSGKGHREEVKAFLDAVQGGGAPIGVDSQLATTLATLEIASALASGRTHDVDLAGLDRRDD